VTFPRAAVLAALALAAGAAWLLASRAPQQRPVARWLSLLLALDAARLLTSSAHAGPRWAFDVALFAGWYLAHVGMVAGAVSRRWLFSAGTALAAWAGVVALLLASGWRGPALAESWRWVYLASVAVQLGALSAYVARAIREGLAPGEPERVALLVGLGSAAGLAGPWLRADVVAAWPVSLPASAVLWAAAAVLQVLRWRRLALLS
jgi:hypothetical protein